MKTVILKQSNNFLADNNTPGVTDVYNLTDLNEWPTILGRNALQNSSFSKITISGQVVQAICEVHIFCPYPYSS